MGKLTLYVFDFDDCIITNHRVDLDSFNTILRNHHLPVLNNRQLLGLRQQGLCANDIFRRITGGSEKELVEERRQLLQSLDIWRNARLNTGGRKALRTIASRNQHAVIATNKPEHLVRPLLSRLRITRYFDEVYTSHDKAAVIRRLKKQKPSASFVFVSDDEKELINVKRLVAKSYCMFNSYKRKNKMLGVTKVVRSLEEVVRE